MAILPAGISDPDTAWMRRRIASRRALGRSALARELCLRKGWLNHRGRPRATFARHLLARLGDQGLIDLPAAKRAVPSRRRADPLESSVFSLPFAEDSVDLHSIEVVPVFKPRSKDAREWKRLLDAYHYLGSGPLCGQRLLYLVKWNGHVLGGLSFSAAAWRLKARDEWIGWRAPARLRNLQRVVCNSRFLLVPKVKNLASKVLALCLKRLPADWTQEHGQTPLLVETFVDTSRFQGTCYTAAGFEHIGKTKGRGRQDRKPKPKHERTPKSIFVKALGEKKHVLEELRREPVLKRQAPSGNFGQDEFGSVEFGDERLKKRLIRMASAFFDRPSANIPEACRSKAATRAAYRFFENEDVTVEAILKAHFESTLGRAASEKTIFAIQDTTFFNYDTHKETEGLGAIGGKAGKSHLGVILHSSLVVNPSGTPLGLIDAQYWCREEKGYGESRQRYKLPIAQKESVKWINGLHAAKDAKTRLGKDVRVVVMGDREADIYELFLEANKSEEGPELLVRALHHNRGIEVEGQDRQLLEYMESLPCAGTGEIEVPKRRLKGGKKAQLEYRFAQVRIKPPKDKRQMKIPLDVWAVLVNEPALAEKQGGLQWLLLTTIPVTNVEECRERINWYRMRWRIEDYHRAIKSGCKSEKRQLRSVETLKKCIALDLVVAYQVFNLSRLARERPDEPCTIALTEKEWKPLVAYTKRSGKIPKTPPPTMQEAVYLIACMGGFMGRKGKSPPGNTTIQRGLEHLGDIRRAFALVWWGDAPEPHYEPADEDEEDEFSLDYG